MQWHDGRKINQTEPIKGQLYVFFVLFFRISLFYAKKAKLPAASSQYAGRLQPLQLVQFVWQQRWQIPRRLFCACMCGLHKEKLIALIRKPTVV